MSIVVDATVVVVISVVVVASVNVVALVEVDSPSVTFFNPFQDFDVANTVQPMIRIPIAAAAHFTSFRRFWSSVTVSSPKSRNSDLELSVYFVARFVVDSTERGRKPLLG